MKTAPGVETLRKGDRVALESHIACRTCYHCRVGQGHNCLNMALLGVHVDGGFAERLVVPAHACFVLPADVSTETGALFESAGVAVHATFVPPTMASVMGGSSRDFRLTTNVAIR